MALRLLVRRALLRRRARACASACPCSRRARRCSSWAKRSARRSSIRSITFCRTAKTFSGERTGNGKALFRFYQDLISLSRRLRSIRSHNIDILHQSNPNRVIAFKRWSGDEEVIVVASLNNAPFANGYVIEKDLIAIPDAGWKEIFNSDAAIYGGQNVGNSGAIIPSTQGRLNVVIPANGFVVLVKQ